MAIRARNGAVLAAIEAVEGTPETLSFVDDAILVADPTITLSPQNETTNEVTGSLDDRGPIVGGMQVSVSFDVYLKGSGTAGVAPEWGVLLRALGWAEVSTAAAVPVSPEAATAGTTTSATGGAGFTATADLYRGMPMELTVNPVGGALTFISDYTVGKLMTFTDVFGSALDVTTLLQIPANVIYKPASTGISSLTLGVYFDGVRYLIAGARGDQSLVLTAAKAGKFSFTFQGIFISKIDDPLLAATYDSTRPPAWRDPDSDSRGACLVDRAEAAVASMTFANGNAVAYPENPNAAQGFDGAIVTGRSMSVSLDPLMTLVATRDVVSDMVAGTQQIVHARYGTIAGNRVAITCPTVLWTGATPGNRQGLLTEEIQGACLGQDAGAFICCY